MEQTTRPTTSTRGIVGLAEGAASVASDKFVDLSYGVGLVMAQAFFVGHTRIVITIVLYGSPVERLVD